MGLHQTEKVVQGIAQQMLIGLSFLHSLRLIHRDVKPSNALISSTGIVKLADFGLARTLESGASLAESFCGTFDYMAPERMIGNSYSFHSDVWSLGLTVHTVAIGSYPYAVEKGGFWAILNAVQEQPIPLPSGDILLAYSVNNSKCPFLRFALPFLLLSTLPANTRYHHYHQSMNILQVLLILLAKLVLGILLIVLLHTRYVM